jgi:arabinofuranosyltransferase
MRARSGMEYEETRRPSVVKAPRALDIVTALVVVGVAIHVVLRLREKPFPFDDSFISFRYADNLVRGRGLVYNPGEHVEGYTNFLWVLLVAAGMRLGFEPLAVSGALGGAALLGNVVLAALVVRSASTGRVAGLLGLAALAWLVLPTDYLPFASCGLETVLVSFLALATGVVAHSGRDGHGLVPEGSRHVWLVSVAPTLLVLTRLDGVLFVLASACITAFQGVRDSRAERGWASAVRGTALVLVRRFWLFAVVIATWTVWKRLYYGDFLPNTYYAKAAYRPEWEAGFEYLRAFVQSYPHVLALGALAAVAVGTAPRSSRALSAWGVLSLAAFFAYVAKVGGDFMHYRFAFEAYPVLVAVAGVGLVTVLERSLAAGVVAAAVATVVAQGWPIMETRFAMMDLGTMRKFYVDGTRSGPALRRHAPPDTIISTSLAGTMAYFSDLTTIDELGLNDRYVAHLPGRMKVRGHVKRAPDEYLVSRGVNLKLTHPWDVPCTRQARNQTKIDRPTKVPLVWLRIDHGECVRMDYLVQTPKLTQWFCDHPKDFVMDDLKCEAPGASDPGGR